MSTARITKQDDGAWKFEWGTNTITRRFATRNQAIQWAEWFADDTGSTFHLVIEKDDDA